ncbi:MAG: hypothetical protein BGO30_02105 [Bacteroidetes bacterium 41-46]|nr:MAG: hypothetical protein BGO30_02105 [Bacteroidetes bacterium 41-46]
MKVKSFFALAALSVALVSCGTKEVPVSEQLVGQWTGMDAITVTVLDSTGAPVTQTMEAPVEFEYLADSTFTAIVMVNDSTNVTLGAVATVADALVNFTGTMNCAQTLEVSGNIVLQGADTLVINYTGVNTEAGITHEGKALVVRKAKTENVEAAPAQ